MNKITVTFELTPKEAKYLADTMMALSDAADENKLENASFWFECIGHHIRDAMRKDHVEESFIIGMKN